MIKTDLYTHLYPEVIEEITRQNDTVIDKAIAAGIAEAKSYMNRYNTALLFFATPAPVGAVTDENLLNKTKDLICWQLIKLANPNINIELFRQAYEDAIRWFEWIMKGQLDPQGWPPVVDDPSTDMVEGTSIMWVANNKRNNQF